MNAADLKYRIERDLKAFQSGSLAENANTLLGTLGYDSNKRLALTPNTAQTFIETFANDKPFDPAKARIAEWRTVDLLFQLTDEEVRVGGGQQTILFESGQTVDGTRMESYLFFAIALSEEKYKRATLAEITREVNKLFAMPAMLLFQYGETLTFAVIDRQMHRRDESRDVLKKVTLIKDIRFADPLRAHIEILYDLALATLHDEYNYHNFVGLHQAWVRRLGSYSLNERFYREVANWYFWALTAEGVKLPRSIEALSDDKEREKQRAIFFIRLLTRLIFCWFLQEKNLVPRDLFRERVKDDLLKDSSPKVGTYYQVFLQNLFFATLNQEQSKRDWRKKYEGSRDGNRGITNLWRYRDMLTSPERLEALLRDHIPFINGGLFDCLDDQTVEPKIFLDGFSERRDNDLCIPNELFFGETSEIDLSEIYFDPRRKREKVQGLIEILGRYKFTVEENTPLEEEIALDPELLGKVFENLLASYNEDTRTTARKTLGAFYTPREIVSYMVDETLRSYLATRVPSVPAETLRALFESHIEFLDLTPLQKADLVTAIGQVRILDPACGSGAFPMGALHRLVDLLQKLDPNNESWKRDRLAEAERYYEVLRQTDAPKEELDQCAARIEDIRHSFDTRFHALDFARKLYLIENCIFGIDIQPIACQIAKLRFFITLIADQNVDPAALNCGVRPLPNLETKIVAADSLVPIERPDRQMNLLDMDVAPIRRELERVRHDHFNARTPARKAECRERDARLRHRIAETLAQNGMPSDSAEALARWDPYDQNHAATFFDSDWMFGKAAMNGKGAGDDETEIGFDVILGNPPYVRIQTLTQQDPRLAAFYKEHYEAATRGNFDLYVVFVEAGLKFLKRDGHLAYILPHKFFNAQYGEPLRRLIARGKYLQGVVHFGDQQVFPGASNYVCLLFLSKTGNNTFRFVQVNDRDAWLRTFEGTEGQLPLPDITTTEWNFVVGRDADVFDRLKEIQTKLEDVTVRIFQGLKTSADKIYIVEEVSRSEEVVRVLSPQTGQQHDLEPDLLHPLIKGGDSKAFLLTTTNRLILFPYSKNADDIRLIPNLALQQLYPLTWAYLETNRQYLENREEGKMQGSNWYAFGRTQALEVMPLPKLFIPDIAPRAAFSYDPVGTVFFTGGVAGGYGLLPRPEVKHELLLGLLNSQVVDFYHHKIATQMRGGWYSYEARFIRHLPIILPTQAQERLIVLLVGYLLWLHGHFSKQNEAVSARDMLMLAFWEQTLNGLVYELYFPEDLHAHNLRIFDLVTEADLPGIEDLPDSERLSRLGEVFETLYDTNHPLRGALFNLSSLETVRIIEGHK